MEISNLDKLEVSQNYPFMSEQFKKNLNWLKENRNKLTRFENNWIAIYNKEVIAFSSNPLELEKTVKMKEINVNDIVIQYMVDSNCVF